MRYLLLIPVAILILIVEIYIPLRMFRFALSGFMFDFMAGKPWVPFSRLIFGGMMIVFWFGIQVVLVRNYWHNFYVKFLRK